MQCKPHIQNALFASRNTTVTQAVIKEAMRAALILTVKTPRGESYQNFIAEVRTKTVESPFYSQQYNHSSFVMTVSTYVLNTVEVISCIVVLETKHTDKGTYEKNCISTK